MGCVTGKCLKQLKGTKKFKCKESQRFSCASLASSTLLVEEVKLWVFCPVCY